VKPIAAGEPCPLCNQPLAARRLASIAGDEGELRITLRGIPVLQCPVDHTYFTKRRFPVWLHTRLIEVDAPSLAAGVASGLLFKRYACVSCGKRLATGSGGGRRDFGFELAFDEQPFRMELSMPVCVCTGCGTEQARSGEELRNLAPSALVHAFKGAGIKAPG